MSGSIEMVEGRQARCAADGQKPQLIQLIDDTRLEQQIKSIVGSYNAWDERRRRLIAAHLTATTATDPARAADGLAR